MTRKLKKVLCYALAFSLIPLGLFVTHTSKTAEPGAEIFLLGLLFFFIILPYFDANREFFPDNDWKMGENGVRYRLRGAGTNTSVEYDVVDMLEKYAQRLRAEERVETENRKPPPS